MATWFPTTAYTAGWRQADEDQAADIDDQMATRQIQSYRWANAAAKTAQTGMAAGDLGYQIDTGIHYRYTTAWVPAWAGAIVCRVRRNTNTPALSTSFTDLSTTANWLTTSPAQNLGFAAYSNGITIPVAGVYEIGYSFISTTSIAILSGVTVNDSSVVVGDLRAMVSSPSVANTTAVTASTEMLLAASDVIRLYSIAASGTPALMASQGEFYASWKRPA